MLTRVSDNSSGSSTQFNFNQAENNYTIEDISGSVRRLSIYSFDTIGRKTQITIEDAGNTYTTNYSYYSYGRLERLTDGNGTLMID